MQLTYRGLTYDYRPPQVEKTQELGLAGSYRGLDYRFRRTAAKNVIQPNVILTYRGVAFNSANPVAPTDNVNTPVIEAAPQVSFQERMRTRLYQQTQAIKKRQQSLLLRLASEIGLDGEQASHHEGTIQGKVPANFRVDYASPGVAMS
ncbi:MAG: DUF4278 domain-containing protein [Synechocystis sp.]|nr:DUF4278 domain-containing protein [Synechocystis sp.]